MKSLECKEQFIRYRAEGKSYPFCQQALGISKSTCEKWTRDLKAEISARKKEHLETLYQEYGMTREARIRSFGTTLYAIEDALTVADLSEVSPDKLLEMKLKYQAALKQEYISTDIKAEVPQDASEIMDSMGDLLVRVQSGEVTAEQAKREMEVLSGMTKTLAEQREADKMALVAEALGM